MKYTITAVKRTPIAKKDGTGTWTKMQVKTQQTGDAVYDLGFSFPKGVKDTLKVGDVLTGYVESRPWSSNGKSGVNLTLNGITAEYVYELLVKLNPQVETMDVGGGSVAVPKAPANDGWETGDGVDELPGEEDEIGF